MSDLVKETAVINLLARGTEGPLTPDQSQCLVGIQLLPRLNSDNGNRENSSPGVIYSPDGLGYLQFDLPFQASSMHETYSMNPAPFSHVSLKQFADSELFSENLIGAVVLSDTSDTSHKMPFTPGQIWGLRSFGQTNPGLSVLKNVDLFEGPTPKSHHIDVFDESMLVGAPSHKLVPIELRAALSSHLTRLLEIPEPKFCLLVSQEPNSQPILVYNYFPTGHPAHCLGYTLLPKLHPCLFDIRIVGAPYKTQIEKYMAPLLPIDRG